MSICRGSRLGGAGARNTAQMDANAPAAPSQITMRRRTRRGGNWRLINPQTQTGGSIVLSGHPPVYSNRLRLRDLSGENLSGENASEKTRREKTRQPELRKFLSNPARTESCYTKPEAAAVQSRNPLSSGWSVFPPQCRSTTLCSRKLTSSGAILKQPASTLATLRLLRSPCEGRHRCDGHCAKVRHALQHLYSRITPSVR